MAENDIVHFLLPDGTKVSNDLRFRDGEEEIFFDDVSLGAKPYKEWTGKELKAEVDRRNVGRDEAQKMSLQGVTKKSQIVNLLMVDDAGVNSGAPAPGAQGSGPAGVDQGDDSEDDGSDDDDDESDDDSDDQE